MADVIAFPRRTSSETGPYREEKIVGTSGGITVRILARTAKPRDFLVVLHGTLDGCTTVAAVPEGEFAVAETMGHSILATLDAASAKWNRQQTA